MKIQTRGRITLPSSIRETLGVEEGDDVAFVEVAGRIEVRKANATGASLRRSDGSRETLSVRITGGPDDAQISLPLD